MDEQFEYKTGRTDPGKSSRGIIAVLLILVIFLGGLVSILSIMNIHLIRRLNDSREVPVSFAEASQDEIALAQEDCLALEGMALQEPDPVYRELHELPEGLFVARVEEGSQAEKLGILPGDVIISLNSAPVPTLEEMRKHIDCKSGFQLALWRDGRELSLFVPH